MDLCAAVMSATIGICYFSFSIHTKPPMKFKIWEQKLKERLDIWYLARQDEELQMVSTIMCCTASFEDFNDFNELKT